jgi:hypothetical protein
MSSDFSPGFQNKKNAPLVFIMAIYKELFFFLQVFTCNYPKTGGEQIRFDNFLGHDTSPDVKSHWDLTKELS